MVAPLTVLLDTDVFSVLFVTAGRHDPRQSDWRSSLRGVQVLIATQTSAELLGGALARGWGSERMGALRSRLDVTPVLPVDESVVEAYARLFADCRLTGHALQAKDHVGDRWIAATAIAFDLPLLSGDALFDDAPGVRTWGSSGT